MGSKKENVMGFKKFISKYYKVGESIKDNYLNQILDKISDGDKITKREKKFLDSFDKRKDKDIMDYRMLDRQMAFDKISTILKSGKKVICNLTDKNGEINLEIKEIMDNYKIGETIMEFSNGEKMTLKDNFLYNIIYNFNKDTHSLEEQEEFFEKIPVRTDENL